LAVAKRRGKTSAFPAGDMRRSRRRKKGTVWEPLQAGGLTRNDRCFPNASIANLALGRPRPPGSTRLLALEAPPVDDDCEGPGRWAGAVRREGRGWCPEVSRQLGRRSKSLRWAQGSSPRRNGTASLGFAHFYRSRRRTARPAKPFARSAGVGGGNGHGSARAVQVRECAADGASAGSKDGADERRRIPEGVKVGVGRRERRGAVGRGTEPGLLGSPRGAAAARAAAGARG